MATSDATLRETISIECGNLLCKMCNLKYTKSKKNYLNWLIMSRFKCLWIYIRIVEIMVFLLTAVSITNNAENYPPYSHNPPLFSDMELVLLESLVKNNIQLGLQSMG